jgi:uncharacterized protein
MPRPRAEEAVLHDLVALYLQVDEAFKTHACPSTTECCRFGVTGREPYITSVEALAVRRAIAARGGPKSWKRASAASGGRRGRLPLVRNDQERACPLLTSTGRCAVYASRPLGCRSYYCDRATSTERVRHAEINAFVREVQTIAARHEPGGDRGRPLTRVLADLV